MNNNFKDLRKAAFAIGFGFTVGKAVGECVGEVCDGILEIIVKRAARNGNGLAQDMCNKAGIKFETGEKKEDSSKVKMGFQPGGEA